MHLSIKKLFWQEEREIRRSLDHTVCSPTNFLLKLKGCFSPSLPYSMHFYPPTWKLLFQPMYIHGCDRGCLKTRPFKNCFHDISLLKVRHHNAYYMMPATRWNDLKYHSHTCSYAKKKSDCSNLKHKYKCLTLMISIHWVRYEFTEKNDHWPRLWLKYIHCSYTSHTEKRFRATLSPFI